MLSIAGRLPAINCTYTSPQKIVQSSKNLTSQTSHAKKVSKSGVDFFVAGRSLYLAGEVFFCNWLDFSPSWLESLPGSLESLQADWLESLPS